MERVKEGESETRLIGRMEEGGGHIMFFFSLSREMTNGKKRCGKNVTKGADIKRKRRSDESK